MTAEAQPMPKATLRRLMAAPDAIEAVHEQRLSEAEAEGARLAARLLRFGLVAKYRPQDRP